MDAGYGYLLKQKIRQITDEWLMEDENMALWLGYGDENLTASKRRILITKFVGEAYELLQQPNYDGFRRNCFAKTGCLLTADGSEDDLVKPEGLLNYKPIPTSNSDSEIEAEIVVPEPDEAPEDIIVPESDEEELGEENNIILEKEDCDDENDRLYNVKLVGTKIRGLYEGSGWSTGTIKYYNSKIDKYLVEFDDKSTDLIKEEEIDGIEICFVVENEKRKKRVDYRALHNGDDSE